MARVALLAGHGAGRLRPGGAGHGHPRPHQVAGTRFRRSRGDVRGHHLPGGRGARRAVHRPAVGPLRPAEPAGGLRDMVLRLYDRRRLRTERGMVQHVPAARRPRPGRLPARRAGVHERLRACRDGREVHHPDHDRLPRRRRGHRVPGPHGDSELADHVRGGRPGRLGPGPLPVVQASGNPPAGAPHPRGRQVPGRHRRPRPRRAGSPRRRKNVPASATWAASPTR